MASPVVGLSEPIDVSIANAASVSGTINLGGRIPVGVYMPAAWTAAGLSFQTSNDGTTWYDLHSAGAELTIAAAAGIYVALDDQPFYGARYLRIRSGTSGVAVAQGALRDLVLMAGTAAVA